MQWLATLGLLLGLAQHGWAQVPTVVVHDYPGPGNMLLKVAIDKKLCEKQGIKCEARVLPLATQAMQAMMGGLIQVALVPGDTVIHAAFNGADVKVIGVGLADPVVFLLGGNHVEWPNQARGYPAVIQDLKGRKVGIPVRGAITEAHLLAMLREAGLSQSDISLIPVGGPTTGYPALINKQIDAMVSFEPSSAFCKAMTTCRMLVDPRKGQGPSFIQKQIGAVLVFAVRADYAAASARSVSALSAAMREAEGFIQNPINREEVLRIARDNFKPDFTPEVAARIVDTVMTDTIPAYKFTLNRKALQNTADFMTSSGLLPKAFDTDALLLK